MILNDLIKQSLTLKQNIGLNKIFNNISWLMFDRIARLFVGVFVAILVARHMGPEQFGLWNYVYAIVGFLSIFATFGLDKIVVKHLVQQKNSKEVLLGTSFILRIIGSLWVVLISCLVVLITKPGETLSLLLVFIASIPHIFYSGKVVDYWFESQVTSRYSVYIKLIALLFSSVWKLLFIFFNLSIIFYAFAFLVEAVMIGCGLLLIYRTKVSSFFKWKFSIETLKGLLLESWPLFFTGLLAMVYMRSDQIMIGMLLGNYDLGIYSVVVKLSALWHFIPNAIVVSFFPSIISARKKIAVYLSKLSKLYFLVTWLSIIVALVISFFGTTVIRLLYGPEYLSAGPILIVHIWSSLFIFQNMVKSNWEIVENYQKYAMIYSIIGAVLNIVLNYFLILSTGILGVAIATLITHFCVVMIFPLFNKKTRLAPKMILYSYFGGSVSK